MKTIEELKDEYLDMRLPTLFKELFENLESLEKRIEELERTVNK